MDQQRKGLPIFQGFGGPDVLVGQALHLLSLVDPVSLR